MAPAAIYICIYIIFNFTTRANKIHDFFTYNFHSFFVSSYVGSTKKSNTAKRCLICSRGGIPRRELTLRHTIVGKVHEWKQSASESGHRGPRQILAIGTPRLTGEMRIDFNACYHRRDYLLVKVVRPRAKDRMR